MTMIGTGFTGMREPQLSKDHHRSAG